MKKDIELLRNIFMYPSKNEYVEQLYDELVDMDWWSDETITNNMQRENFLYEKFIEYYNAIINGEIKEISMFGQVERMELLLINRCKIQLDKEILRVKNGDYIKYDEET